MSSPVILVLRDRNSDRHRREWRSHIVTAGLVSGEFSEYLAGLMTRRSVTHPPSKARKALRHDPRFHGHNSSEQQGMAASATNLERIRYLHVALLGSTGKASGGHVRNPCCGCSRVPGKPLARGSAGASSTIGCVGRLGKRLSRYPDKPVQPHLWVTVRSRPGPNDTYSHQM